MNDDHYLAFWQQVYELIVETEGDRQALYFLLQKHQHLLDESFSCWLTQSAREIFSEATSVEKFFIAKTIGQFSDLILNFGLGNLKANQEIGINGLHLILTVFTRETFPEYWAITQYTLGKAYKNRFAGQKRENVEVAIICYQNALQEFTREKYPLDWAMTYNSLGNAYSNRIEGNQKNNLEQAIISYKLALEERTKEQMPLDWAMTQHNLGNAYVKRVKGNKKDNIEQAIISYKLALEERIKERQPLEWARCNGLQLSESGIAIIGTLGQD